MSLTIVKFSPGLIRVIVPLIALVSAVAAFYFIRWNFANAVAGNGIDSKIPEARSVAEWLPRTAPDDAETHFAAAQYFEKTFDPDDLARAQQEYETAVSLSPYNYSLWVLLARSRDRNGDAVGAEAAYNRAFELAPNYASVKWGYGNSLIRHGRQEEGFKLVADAAQNDIQYRGQAVSTALQVFDDDVDKARGALGNTPEVNATLADVLFGHKRYDESYAAWSRLSSESKVDKYKELGQSLMAHAIQAHQFRLAAQFAGDLITDGTERPVAGRLKNGGFENGIKLRNPGEFEWQVADGSEPQIGLSEGVKRSGRYSLWITFNSFGAAEFRSISQTGSVVPGASYELTGYYRAEVKTNATFKWEILEPINFTQLAITDPLVFAGDWTSFHAKFKVPDTIDGIIIRFVRLGCGSTGACPVTGKIAFDDLSLTQVSQ